ncbi:MAG: helix-turn-helix domain-containing protein [Treponema sp.]|nr:helix-turn-helix domain-containing protein [Treponema sp.]
MDSYGELLKNKREEKLLSLDTISAALTIDKKYLAGLEEEDNSVFPGEPYLIGFMKNYSEYLELDSDYILKLYHNKKIQESPVPEGLIEKPKSEKFLPILISSISAVVVIVIVVVLVLVLRKKPVEEDNVLLAGAVKNQSYELGEKKFQQRLYKGDQITIPGNAGKIVLTVKETLKSFAIDTPAGVFYTDLAEENEFDINGDGNSDLIVYVSDISLNDEKRGAEVSLLLRHGVSTGGADSSTSIENIPFADEIQSKHPQHVILEDNRAYPFSLNATFRASCVFRDKIDFGSSVESYFSNGEQFSASAHNGIRIWMSNSNAVKFTVVADARTYDLEIGKAGQPLVQDIKWIKDTDGRYKLVVIELD